MKTKVLLLSQYPPHIGGVSTHAYNITKNNKNIKFYVLSYNKKEKTIKTPENVEIKYLSNLNFTGGRGSSYSLLAMKKGTEIVKKEKIDIIHSQYAGPPSIAGYLIKKKTKTPLVTTIHGSDQTMIKYKPVQKSLENSDTVITVSKYLKNHVNKKISNENIVKITNGVSEVFKKNEARKTQREYITYVGELTSYKGIEDLIEVSKKIDQKFLIIGNGNLKNKLESKSGDNVIFTGYQEKERIPEYLNKSKILVLPSHREGFGLTLIEAMKCGTPVIGRKTQGILEIIKHTKNGMLFNNQKDLKKQIEKLINNKKIWTKLSFNGKKFSKKFSWKKTAEKTSKIYRNLKKEN